MPINMTEQNKVAKKNARKKAVGKKVAVITRNGRRFVSRKILDPANPPSHRELTASAIRDAIQKIRTVSGD